MWFFPHFLTPPKKWISKLIHVKTPGKTETRLFLIWVHSLIQVTVLFRYKHHSWGCGVRGNGLTWGSREAGNLSDSVVIKAHVSWYSACHKAAVKIWNASHCEKSIFPFLTGCWKGWLPHSSHHKGTGDTRVGLSCCKAWSFPSEHNWRNSTGMLKYIGVKWWPVTTV